MKHFKHAIALTGGIATGKSTVANLFMMYGFLIIDADKIAHKLLDIHTLDISKLFGEKYIKDNKVDRPELGKLIFSDNKAKKELEEFLHPLIKETIIEESKIFEEAKKPYLIDIPLFFENNNYDIDRSIVVYCEKDTQLQRVIKRDNIDELSALQRINSQMNIEEKKLLSTFVIDNTQNLKHLQKEVDIIINNLI
jgi:dephospho-CoA kinase